MEPNAIQADTRVGPQPRPGITACIATHPARLENKLLARALRSVILQTHQPAAIIVSNDLAREGATANRQHILDAVQTDWMAWLDSDDEWYPDHLEKLWRTAEQTGAMFVFPWFDAPADPLGHFGLPFNPATPHHTTITFLVKTEYARRVGFTHGHAEGTFSNEDWGHLLGLCQ